MSVIATPNDREYNFPEFIRSTVAPLIHTRGDINQTPILGCDECLNDKITEAMGLRLLRSGIISGTVPLWHSQRVTPSGEKFLVMGISISRNINRLGLHVGKPMKGFSWPDERVIGHLVVHFTAHDRLCFLTSDINKIPLGVRVLLETEVAPALERLADKRLGLLVLAKTPRTNLINYASAVESHLTANGVSEGFSWKEF